MHISIPPYNIISIINIWDFIQREINDENSPHLAGDG
jgi:hypothetical protein